MINYKDNFKENKGTIFIVGNQRSGTTIITRLLDGHPQILSMLGESNFFTQMDARRRINNIEQYFFYLTGRPFDYGKGAKQTMGTYIKRNKNWQPIDLWKNIIKNSRNIGSDELELKKAIKTGDQKKIFMAIANIYAKYNWPYDYKPKYVLEKTPGNEFCLDKIFHIFPNAKIIHIIRDPFDVIESIFRDKNENMRKDRLMLYINIWKSSLMQGLKYSKKYPQNYCFVKFENLISSTEVVMRKLCQFLEIEFHIDLLIPTNNSGKRLWESHTHQNMEVAKGIVEKKLLEKDAYNELGGEYMKIIGRFIGHEYSLFKWNKYYKYANNNPIIMLTVKYPNKNIFNLAKNAKNYLISMIACRINSIRYL